MDAAVSNIAVLGAAEAARRIAAGEISARQLVEACLDQIEAREESVQAWQYLDREQALAQAARADEWRATGRTCGALHGVPVGIKDIFDTEDMPTEHGSAYFAGRRPHEDAAAVRALRDAGAVIMGKTVSAELAVFAPGKTRNPHDGTRTPGGSSSGSAAAVASHMVPLALGTQTAGSVIRPASFCGVYGYKPTFGLLSRHGVLVQSPSLDTVGLFARTIEDLALTADCLTAFDPRDAGMWPRSRPRMFETAGEEPPVPPALAFVKGPAWDAAEPVMAEAFGELCEALGDRCEEVDLPEVYAEGLHWQRMLQMVEIAKHFGPFVDRAPDSFSDTLKAFVDEGRKVPAVQYITARDYQTVLNAGLDRVFERYDAVVTPSATGPAPKGLESTGNPVFCALWTYVGVPALSLPLLEADGLPLGVQLVGPRRDDARLLRTGRWLVRTLETLA